MMKTPRHLSWENFRTSIIAKGQQRVHRVSDSPRIELFSDGLQNRIGMWLEIPPGIAVPTEINKLAFVSARLLKRKGINILELVGSSFALQRHFYHFAVAVAERILVEKSVVSDAVVLELKCFAELLEEKQLLGIERQLGLFGELVILERLVAKNGPDALDAWIGPQREPHDFRLGTHEYEVKTTLYANRVHTINGIEQLIPSKGCKLFLLSVLLGPAGLKDGASLQDKAQRLSAIFKAVPSHLERFTTALEACGFRSADRNHYTRRFVMRRPLAVIQVDKKFPAITRPTIHTALGPLAVRVEAVQYDVNVEGLGHEEGTPKFPADFPA